MDPAAAEPPAEGASSASASNLASKTTQPVENQSKVETHTTPAKMEHPPLHGWAGFAQFCCNTEDGSCMGRTKLSWFKIFIYYVIFYLALFSFFVLLLFAALYSFEKQMPRHLPNHYPHLIGTPGLGFRPVNTEMLDSSLLWFNLKNAMSYKDYVSQLTKITQFENKELKDKFVDCHSLKDVGAWSATYADPNFKGLCKVFNDEKHWGDCVPSKGFGYAKGEPCVLIRLNKIIGWLPKEIGDSSKLGYDLSNIQIKNKNGIGETALSTSHNAVCVKCEGETEMDKELLGQVKYYPYENRPGPCIPIYYFPYLNQPGYQPPFIFVQFSQLPLHTFIQVKCEAYNKEIKIDEKKGLGTVKFELLIDNK